MKILRIVSLGYEEGGVENGIKLMQPILESRGHEVRVMASDYRMDMPRFADYTFKGADKSYAKFLYRIFNPHSFLLLRKILKEYKPDLVQLHTLGRVSPSVLFLLRNIPTVVTIHGPEEFMPSLLMWHLPTADFKDHSHDRKQLTLLGELHYFYARYVTTPVYRLGLRNVDVIVTFSKYMQRFVRSEGLENEYVPNGTKLLVLKPLPQTQTIAFIGRLEGVKGVEYLLKAMPEIIGQYPEANLIIAGDGTYRETLEALAHTLGIDAHVKFLGHISREEAANVYEDSSMLVMPSIWPEAFGKVGIEAMSVGRPVIASDVGGVSDWLVDGETGYLVPPADAHAIAKSVGKLLSDPGLLQRMSLNARKRAEDFTLEDHTDKILSIYESLLWRYKKQGS